MTAYVTLKLGETKNGSAKTLHALRTTADYYGWTEAFPEWVGKDSFVEGGRTYLQSPSRRGHPQCSSGRRIRISRSPVTNGFPAGFTNAFKVSSNVGLFDLAELAHFTKGEWFWMTAVDYKRVSKEQWADRYAART